jgi:RNA polymerase sigma-70 factor (ECF subfamily)
LLKTLRKLPPERQQLIILKFVEGLSNAEIGLIMRISEGAIKSLYHRTLGSLKKEIEKLENPVKGKGKKIKKEKR